MLKNLIYVLTLKKIPVLHWTSKYEYNLKPKLITVFYLIFGLILFTFIMSIIFFNEIGLLEHTFIISLEMEHKTYN